MSVIPVIIPRTRKGLIILLSVLFIICAGAAVFTYFSWSADQQALKTGGQPDFNTLSETDLKDGLIVTGKIDMALEAYAEEYDTTVGIRTSDDSETLYYVVPIYDEAADGSVSINYLITYKADPKDFDTLDAIVDYTWNDVAEPAPLAVENAEISTLPSDIKGYYTEWANDPTFYENGSFIDWCAEMDIFGTSDKAVIESKMVPFMIDRTSTAGTDPTIVWLFTGFSGLCLIILVVLLLRKKPISGIIDNTGDPDIMRPKQ